MSKSPTCAVVTPIGPGHVELYSRCRDSVQRAWAAGHGPFGDIKLVDVDDTAGAHGRSRARNMGVAAAQNAGTEWIFFLDADDTMSEKAFASAGPHLGGVDALWGLITESGAPSSTPTLRLPQVLRMDCLEDVLLFDPFLTLQMGHFVRTSVARQLPFNEQMDVGEDFDYYLRLWQAHRCLKVPHVLFINHRDQHSTGPSAATGRDWRPTVESQLQRERERLSLHVSSKHAIDIRNRATLDLQAFFRKQSLATAHNTLELSQQFPFRGYYDVDGYHGDAFVLFSDNDDHIVASHGWTGSYEPMTTRLWQALASDATLVLDIGAYDGFYGFLAGRANSNSRVFCFEPFGRNHSRAVLNTHLNRFTNVTVVRAAAADRNAWAPLHAPVDGDFLTTRASLQLPDGSAVPTEMVRTLSIDTFLSANELPAPNLVKITTEGSEYQVLQGMAKALKASNPDLIIEVDREAEQEQVQTLLQSCGYRFYSIREDTRRVEPSDRLPLGNEVRRLNCLASARDHSNIDRIITSAP